MIFVCSTCIDQRTRISGLRPRLSSSFNRAKFSSATMCNKLTFRATCIHKYLEYTLVVRRYFSIGAQTVPLHVPRVCSNWRQTKARNIVVTSRGARAKFIIAPVTFMRGIHGREHSENTEKTKNHVVGNEGILHKSRTSIGRAWGSKRSTVCTRRERPTRFSSNIDALPRQT